MQADRLQQALQRSAYLVVVVDDDNGRFRVVRPASSILLRLNRVGGMRPLIARSNLSPIAAAAITVSLEGRRGALTRKTPPPADDGGHRRSAGQGQRKGDLLQRDSVIY